MYHYVPALMVGMMLTCFCVDRLRVIIAAAGGRGFVRWLPIIATGGVVIAGFLYWGLPEVYGYPLTPAEREARQWVAKW